ncbi:hypothetical protein [Dechloromonas sp. H13]|uniref:hypothetical protein n=1 Tax=Dechloromonas sp. H13 TaxID=2570193 RepID=UPI0012922F9F|nr:hypothetical protein [Dechloromonas sp. H13]
MKIKLPERCFFTVDQLAARWEVSPDDINHLFETGQLTKRSKMAVLEGGPDAEYVSFDIIESPYGTDFDLMPSEGLGYLIDGIHFGREVRVNIYLDDVTRLMPQAEIYACVERFIASHFPDRAVHVVAIEDVIAFEREYAFQEIKETCPPNEPASATIRILPVSSEVTKVSQPYDAPKIEIRGDIFRRLQRAISAFPSRYPDYKTEQPKLTIDVRAWLKEVSLAMNDREAHVFGAIIAEHFDLSGDTQKT